MFKLTTEEKDFIAARESETAIIIKSLEASRLFKLGDYLIGFHPQSPLDNKKRPVTNSYGVVKKFQVVAVDGFGIPYMKELNKNGKPYGTLICPLKFGYEQRYYGSDIKFELDPDYADALILEDDDFNASLNHRVKADLFKEITKYNKENKINTKDRKTLVAFIDSLVGGDVVWRSNTTSWLVLSNGPIPRDASNRIIQDKAFIQIQTSKGEIKDLAFWDLNGKTLYKNRPRSYKELRDLI